MAKKQQSVPKIPVKDMEVDGVYKTYVQEIVKILEINKETETIVLFNISGAHKQWIEFRNIYLIERIR